MKSDNNFTLLIADDHELVRLGLREIMENDHSISIIEETDNGEDAVELVDCYCPDLVLLDLNMPRMNGWEAGRIIKNLHPKVKVVLFVADDGTDFVSKNNGISTDGLISKQLAAKEITESLHRIAAGEKVVKVNCRSCYKDILIYEENVA